MMPKERTHRDGRPYYCVVCGAGWAEFIACERADCLLEASAIAEARKEQADAFVSLETKT